VEPWHLDLHSFALSDQRQNGRLTGAAWCFLGAFLVKSAGYGVVGEDGRRCEQGNAQGGDRWEHGRRESSWMACAGFRARRRGDGVDRGAICRLGKADVGMRGRDVVEDVETDAV